MYAGVGGGAFASDRRLETIATFHKVAADVPVRPQRCDEPQLGLHVAGRNGERRRGPHVVDVRVELPQAAKLPRPAGLGRLGKGQEVFRMTLPNGGGLPAQFQAFGRVLPHGLEKAVPGLAVALLGHDERRFHQPPHEVVGFPVQTSEADRGSGGEREASGEDRQSIEQRPLFGREQLIAPVHGRPEGPMAGR